MGGTAVRPRHRGQIRQRARLNSGLHFDYLGSLTAITHPTQGVWWRQSSDAWGSHLQSTDSAPQPWPSKDRGYAGAWGYDRDLSGPYNVGVRAYDPVLGRFRQRDEAGAGHPYAYCDNSPAWRVDPSGAISLSALKQGFVSLFRAGRNLIPGARYVDFGCSFGLQGGITLGLLFRTDGSGMRPYAGGYPGTGPGCQLMLDLDQAGYGTGPAATVSAGFIGGASLASALPRGEPNWREVGIMTPGVTVSGTYTFGHEPAPESAVPAGYQILP